MSVANSASRLVVPPYPTLPASGTGNAARQGAASAAASATLPTKSTPAASPQPARDASPEGRSIARQIASAVWTVLTWPFAMLYWLGATLAHAVQALWSDTPVADAETQPLMAEVRPVGSYPTTAPSGKTPPAQATPATSPTPPAPSPATPSPAASQRAHGTASMRSLLSDTNDTAEARARNRESYLRGTTELGHWGGQLEAVGLAAIANTRTQVWLPKAGDGQRTYVCHVVLQPEGSHLVDLKLVDDIGHYRSLLPAGNQSARVAQGEACGADSFREVDVLGAGDCLYLAFAYAADTPYVRELTDFLNARKAGAQSPPSIAHLRSNAVVVESLGLQVDPSAGDDAFARAALEAVVRIKRRALAKELAQPHYQDSLDAVVAQVLAEN